MLPSKLIHLIFCDSFSVRGAINDILTRSSPKLQLGKGSGPNVTIVEYRFLLCLVLGFVEFVFRFLGVQKP